MLTIGRVIISKLSSAKRYCSPHSKCHYAFYGVGKAVPPDWLGQHWSAGHLCSEQSDSLAISASGDKDDWNVALLSKSTGDLNPFSISFEIYVHQDDVGWIVHCTGESLMAVCG